MSKDKKSKKKKKTIYIDDGRTIADMSSVTPGGGRYRSGKKGTLKDHATTYFEACKLMFKPMLIVMGAICLIFGILYLVFEFIG